MKRERHRAIMILTFLFVCLSPVAIDGDTLRCAVSEQRVRLFGVDTPERGSPNYAEATRALQARIAGGLMCEPKGTSYNRIVALCRNASGEDVGERQLRDGWAIEACAYSRNLYGTCQ
jgi:endonuclease YncB( thermonuclease family)